MYDDVSIANYCRLLNIQYIQYIFNLFFVQHFGYFGVHVTGET